MFTIAWQEDKVVMLDQRHLPFREKYVVCATPAQVIDAIRKMVIRGAPAIGIAAAMGLALGAARWRSCTRTTFEQRFRALCTRMAAARPTARNLFWAIERMQQVLRRHPEATAAELSYRLRQESEVILQEDVEINKAIGDHGQQVVPEGATVLTHCNAGALATGGYGTALGVIRAAHAAGKNIRVIADETRPFLQGSRLTAWELQREKIPVTVITDNMAGHLIHQGMVDLVIVGADRIAANGDAANKVGTYTLGVLARENGIPFYVAAPLSTVDFGVATGKDIPIEERNPREVTHCGGRPVVPPGVPVANYAFDVTPGRYLTGIITEAGVARPPYGRTLRRLAKAGKS